MFAGACSNPVSSTSLCLSLRTQARPAIEFVSGEEGLRPKSYFFLFLFFKYTFMDNLNYEMAPGSSCGAEGDGGTASLTATAYSVSQCVVSLHPVTEVFLPKRCL